ncbi:F0F1-type ATP synthase, alpha subunit [Halobacteroides halobius DSM 5150]|uniref:ATP synthase subunit a n=1 Tax=Halobacteroides halobius (strain ATCC 35273 / DSM 5150 / MD-1) TaxID=748449 RepID=L0KDA4_HALHC|nr:F0F1 ATP synthase subunit A [Halobacteroides halobius]AGB42339.1 F0F1-type ATP synthase, alpha subunit [Halobacteroides halobius DSM 5150]
MSILDKIFLKGAPSADAFSPDVIFYLPDNALTRILQIANAPIKSTVTTTWVIMALLAIFSWLATRNLEREPKPGSLQNIAEAFVENISSLVETTMGSDMKKFTPYIGTLIIYLTIANIIGIVPGRDVLHLYTPTADLNTTFALAAITFFNIHYFGIKANGIKDYLKGYFEPMPLLFPLNIIGNLADPVSLSFRLFGNMMASVVIMGLLYGVVSLVIPGLADLYFNLFSGVLQAFIFSMLTMTYISMEME